MSGLPPPPPAGGPLPPGTPAPPGAAVPPGAPGSGGRRGLVAVIAVVVLLLVGGAAFGAYLLGRNSAGQPPAASASASASATASATAATTPSVSASPTAVPGTASDADLRTLSDALYPTTEGGLRTTCYQGDTTFAQCPVTDRLRAALEAQVAKQQSGGADPICGCQNVDANLAVTFRHSGSTAGTIVVSMFSGQDRIDYVVVAGSAGYLVDDIDYCTASPPASIEGTPATC